MLNADGSLAWAKGMARKHNSSANAGNKKQATNTPVILSADKRGTVNRKKPVCNPNGTQMSAVIDSSNPAMFQLAALGKVRQAETTLAASKLRNCTMSK
jgi:hypothetical protein